MQAFKIITMHYIYKKFLDNRNIYKKNVSFWNNIITDLLNSEKFEFDEYVATSDGFGNEFYDGNPIYNFKIDKLNKGVRIIQQELEESVIQLSAWIEEAELVNGEIIDELVINLELTTETVFIVIDLINAWILNDLTKFRMKRYINTLKGLRIRVAGLQETESI